MTDGVNFGIRIAQRSLPWAVRHAFDEAIVIVASC
jgi:hypothetical protein